MSKIKTTTTIHSLSLHGLTCQPVEIEVDIAAGLPNFIMVGLPDAAVSEARDRVRAAIKNSGFDFPRTRVTVNLAPAYSRKEGSMFDLPIALGILVASGQIPVHVFSGEPQLFVGELALDGRLRAVRGALCLARAAQQANYSLFLPQENAAEAALLNTRNFFAVESLKNLVSHLCAREELLPVVATAVLHTIAPSPSPSSFDSLDMADILGQSLAKRALEIAAAGNHNVLLVGPPGAGKSMLARALPSILPKMTNNEIIETNMVYSISPHAAIASLGLLTTRPFRSPHHTASAAAIMGGGPQLLPGEISLAHNGVLYFDELPEFRRDVLEALRQPLEEGNVHLARAKQAVTYPANIMLVASMNPCPCGYWRDPHKECTCLPLQIYKYQHKLSGPLRDRIDLAIKVGRPSYAKLTSTPTSSAHESSASIKKRVEAARREQHQRFCGQKITTNSQMTKKEIDKFCQLDAVSQRLLRLAMSKWHLSPRAYFCAIKVARTIADLAATTVITAAHVQEALQYRVTAHSE